jgi:hypothetical protein
MSAQTKLFSRQTAKGIITALEDPQFMPDINYFAKLHKLNERLIALGAKVYQYEDGKPRKRITNL